MITFIREQEKESPKRPICLLVALIRIFGFVDGLAIWGVIFMLLLFFMAILPQLK